MDRRLLFPIAAVTAWAQQPSPEAAAAEEALRARVNEFFKLQVDKKFRQAEALIADDSKDDYYNGNKFNIRGFSIEKVELLENNTRAKVLIKAQVTLVLPAGGPVNLDAPQETLWKVEDGKWVWYVLHGGLLTPFGVIKPENGAPPPTSAQSKVGKAPDLATLMSSVKADRDSVFLTRDDPEQVVMISNDLPGDVDLAITTAPTAGVSVAIEKKHLNAGEKTPVRFKMTDGALRGKVLEILASPLGVVLTIQVAKQ